MKWKDMEEVGESGHNKQSEREAQLREKKVLNQSKKIFWSPTLVWFAGFRGAFESLQLDSLQRPATQRNTR